MVCCLMDEGVGGSHVPKEQSSRKKKQRKESLASVGPAQSRGQWAGETGKGRFV